MKTSKARFRIPVNKGSEQSTKTPPLNPRLAPPQHPKKDVISKIKKPATVNKARNPSRRAPLPPRTTAKLSSDIKADDSLQAELPIPSQSSPHFFGILSSKLDVCMAKLPAGTSEESQLYKAKTQRLNEITDFLENCNGKVPEMLKNKIIETLEANIIRSIPEIDTNLYFYEDYSNQPTQMSIHCTATYSILIRFFEFFPTDQCFSLPFLVKLLNMTATTDDTERDLLVMLFSHILRIRSEVVSTIVNRIGYIFFEFMETSSHPGRIWACLKILNEFFLAIDPAPFSNFFLYCVVPLSSHSLFTYFDIQFGEMCIFFLSECVCVVEQMLKHWPKQSIGKQISFIITLYNVFPLLEDEEKSDFIRPFIRNLAEAATFSSPGLAIAALHVHMYEGMKVVLNQYKEVIFPILAPAVFAAMETHWNEDVRNTAIETSEFLMAMDTELTLSTEPDNIENKTDTAETWRIALEMAANNCSNIDTAEYETGIMNLFLK